MNIFIVTLIILKENILKNKLKNKCFSIKENCFITLTIFESRCLSLFSRAWSFNIYTFRTYPSGLYLSSVLKKKMILN